jgi:hypothetical protein
MNDMQIAARFTAFTAYLNAETGQPRSPAKAGRFARENWEWFLPFVDQDLARFLTTRPASSSKAGSVASCRWR